VAIAFGEFGVLLDQVADDDLTCMSIHTESREDNVKQARDHTPLDHRSP
jgi:hypothetical protein